MIPYQPFAEHLKSIGVLATPSELQAQATAVLCVNKATPFDHWFKSITEDYCVENPDDVNLRHVMTAVFDFAKEQLAKDDYSYQLLLPQEEFTLAERIEILSDWVSTFLSALGTAGFVAESLSKECNEFINDLDKIARIDNTIEGLEGEELDFIEITEYIRSGVMILYVEMNQGNSKPKYIN